MDGKGAHCTFTQAPTKSFSGMYFAPAPRASFAFGEGEACSDEILSQIQWSAELVQSADTTKLTGTVGTVTWDNEKKYFEVSFPQLSAEVGHLDKEVGVWTGTLRFLCALSGVEKFRQEYPVQVFPSTLAGTQFSVSHHLHCSHQILEISEVILNGIHPHAGELRSETRVTIYGQGFYAPSFVFFGCVLATVVECTDNTLVCLTPKLRSGIYPHL